MLLFGFLTGQAQEKGNDTIPEKLEEVVITAQYTPQSEHNAVYKVKSISQQTIQQKAVTNLRELLQQELNIDLSQNSVFGTGIEIQGISKENIKILIDGVPVIGRLNGVIDLNQINLANIERVEIIEGPVSVFYGTDAMGGVINLITKQNQKKQLEGNLSAYYESIDATRFSGNLGYKFDNNLIKAGGGYYHFNGLSTNDNPRNLNWEERKQHFADFMFLKGFKNAKLRYNASFSNEKLISLGEPDRFGNIQDKDYFTRRIDNALNFQGTVLTNKFLDATASFSDYQRYHDTYDVNPNTYEQTLSQSDTKEDNIVTYRYGGLKWQLGKSKKTEKLNYAIGTDYFEESTTGSRILNRKQSINTFATFASINYKIISGFEIQPGVRYTWNSAYGNLISPAFNTKIRINNNNTLRLSYARGFRAPSVKELYLDFRINAGQVTFVISGNENLEVEESHSVNLYYTFNKTFSDDTSLKIEPAIFYNDVTNLIALSQLQNFKRHYINIDKFKSVGGKINTMFAFSKQLSFQAGFALIGRYNKFKEDYNTDEFLYTPEATSTLDYQLPKQGVSVNLYYKFTGAQTGFIIDEDTDELSKTTRERFHNLDITLTKNLFSKALVFTIGAKNIFDVKDLETTNAIGEAHARDMQLWGTSFFIKTNFNF